MITQQDRETDGKLNCQADGKSLLDTW